MAIRDTNQSRQWAIIGIFITASLILLFRAVQLQLLSPTYRAKADAITIERDVLYPSRGVIYDRNNRLLVYNNAMYDIMVTYKQIDPKMDTLKLCRMLNIDTATFHLNLTKDWASGRYSKNIPFAFMTMITPEHYARFQEVLHEFPGFEAKERNVRGYPQHNAGHVLGYLNEVSDKQVKDSSSVYENGDYIGAAGLEKYYEPILRGRKGIRFILKDNIGRLVGRWKEGKLDTAATQGRDLMSTIDLRLQKLGEQLMKGKIGAIVALEPKTGEILAMITSPTFDPEQMVISKLRGNFIASMYHDSLKPLFNRSITAEYAPGSIYKPFVAAVALQMGVWDKNEGLSCNGGYHYNTLTVKCHPHAHVGNLSDAIEHSCNNYFCTVYRSIVDRFGFRNARQGLDSLNVYALRFGLGRPLGVDFPAEKDGYLPTPKLYDRMYRKDKVWYSTNFVSNGIGQGENQITTMQMANIAAIIANRGWYITPHLIRGARDTAEGHGYMPLSDKYTMPHSTGVAATHFEYIVNGMRQVVATGTGSNARLEGISVCGKTGTVENPHGNDSSVFMGFAPQDDPKIVIAVYVEHGGWGNDFAAPITGLMIEQFLKGEIPASRKYWIDRMEHSRLAYSEGRGYYVTKGY